MTLPTGHLSHSQAGTWERCQLQYKLFRIEGAKAPPDFALATKIATHKAILEDDLAYKLKTGGNRSNIEIAEGYRASLETQAHLLAEDPNLEGPVVGAIETEVRYFDKLLDASEAWRRQVKPLKVEEPFEIEMGGIPIHGRIDLIMDEEIWDRIVDLKRLGKAPTKNPERARQLVTYSAATGITGVGIAALIENVRPKMDTSSVGVVTPGMVGRVTRGYQATAEQIENAVVSGIFAPAPLGNAQTDWVCSKKYCGAWAIGSKDWVTGRNIACEFGEKAVVSVAVGGITVNTIGGDE